MPKVSYLTILRIIATMVHRVISFKAFFSLLGVEITNKKSDVLIF